jgi:hypothetical protein
MFHRIHPLFHLSSKIFILHSYNLSLLNFFFILSPITSCIV